MKKKILNIVGARPQIIKAAALSRVIKADFSDKIEDVIVHTGQHYDYNMSQIFFDELEIPYPHINMNVGSASHASQTAQIMLKAEEIISSEKPDVVVVYGDTNSTLAVSLVAAKLHYPLAHIEAGLRSFNKRMPEEINRITCDHVSTILFAPTQTAMQNLANEGFNLQHKAPYSIDNPLVVMSGDIMFDNAIYFSNKAVNPKVLLDCKKDFLLVTIHRESNTDDLNNLKQIMHILLGLIEEHNVSIIFPVHPRTIKKLSNELPELKTTIDKQPDFYLIEPVSYLEMLALLKQCKLVLTDSGGLQKEAYFMQKPCVILRTETEWTEIVEQGAGKVTDIDPIKVRTAVQYFLLHADKIAYLPVFGNGSAAKYICEILTSYESV